MRNILILILLFSILSCHIQSNKIFWIDKKDHNFQTMIESKNALPIKADSVRKYLNWEEIASTKLLESQVYPINTILPNPAIYKNYGEIYRSKYFKANVILKIGNDSLGKDYKFFIRTYTNDWKIIDNFDLAIWNENDNIVCIGSINKNLIIERKCDNSESSDIMQITTDGKIIMTSYNKP